MTQLTEPSHRLGPVLFRYKMNTSLLDTVKHNSFSHLDRLVRSSSIIFRSCYSLKNSSLLEKMSDSWRIYLSLTCCLVSFIIINVFTADMTISQPFDPVVWSMFTLLNFVLWLATIWIREFIVEGQR